MALGRKGGTSNLTLYILKLKTKDSNGQNVDPFFQISSKEDGKWTVSEKTETSVSGKLFKVEPRVGEFQGEPILSSQVFLKDGEEAYLLDLKYTMLSRSIINSLLNLSDFNKEVEISLYKNKKGYPAASVRANGSLVDWKYGLDELPQPEKVKFKGKEMSDFSKVDAFFQKEAKELGDRLSSSENGDNSDVAEGTGGSLAGVDRTASSTNYADSDDEEEDKPLF